MSKNVNGHFEERQEETVDNQTTNQLQEDNLKCSCRWQKGTQSSASGSGQASFADRPTTGFTFEQQPLFFFCPDSVCEVLESCDVCIRSVQPLIGTVRSEDYLAQDGTLSNAH